MENKTKIIKKNSSLSFSFFSIWIAHRFHYFYRPVEWSRRGGEAGVVFDLAEGDETC